MLMSELVTHASAEKCGDLLKVRKPTQEALHKGATLIIMVLFFLKHSTNLLWLGTSTTPEPSSRGKKRARDVNKGARFVVKYSANARVAIRLQ